MGARHDGAERLALRRARARFDAPVYRRARRAWLASVVLHAVVAAALVATGVGLAEAPADPASVRIAVEVAMQPELVETPPLEIEETPIPEKQLYESAPEPLPELVDMRIEPPVPRPTIVVEDPMASTSNVRLQGPGFRKAPARDGATGDVGGEGTESDDGDPTAEGGGETVAPPTQRRDPVITYPEPPELSDPPYPERAQIRGWTGWAKVRAHVDASGVVVRVDALDGTHQCFKSAARDLIATCRFRPATRDGVPVSGIWEGTLKYELK